MDEKQAAELLEKYRAGTCTPEELRLVRRAFLGFPLADVPQASDADYNRWKAEAWVRLTTKTQPRPRVIRWLPYAAAALLVASVAGWLVLGDRWSVIGERQLVATEILPGGNKATLTLADGRVINLDEAQTGIVIGTENITYNDGSSLGAVMVSGVEPSLQNGRDPSQAQSLPRLVGGDAPMMLSLTTPKGGTYQITLPDGSKVWLNSASTLKYPSRFSGHSREVILHGEAYFDIEPLAVMVSGAEPSLPNKAATRSTPLRSAQGDVKVPFKVKTDNQTVEVLGTQFNISAYTDDPETKTTLVEGKVRVEANGTSLELVPGEQGAVTVKGLSKREVDTEQYASWRDGYFTLRGTIPELLKQLGRWYDIEVVYEGGQADTITFYATLQRDVPLADLLETWQHYDPNLQFKLEQITGIGNKSGNKAERRLTISRK